MGSLAIRLTATDPALKFCRLRGESVMADTPMDYGPTASSAAERLRIFAIVVYVLYLLSAPSIFSTMLIGVVVAYVKRGEARGTPFESHFANAIELFWVTLVV